MRGARVEVAPLAICIPCERHTTAPCGELEMACSVRELPCSVWDGYSGMVAAACGLLTLRRIRADRQNPKQRVRCANPRRPQKARRPKRASRCRAEVRREQGAGRREQGGGSRRRDQGGRRVTKRGWVHEEQRCWRRILHERGSLRRQRDGCGWMMRARLSSPPLSGRSQHLHSSLVLGKGTRL